jgi:adenylosuccinate lyase
MLTCPLDFRYGRAPAKAIFSESRKLELMLRVEAALARAQAGLGTVPVEAAEEIARAAASGKVTVEKVAKAEARVKHDIMGLVHTLSSACKGDAGKYIHLGATSNDIIDTATGLQLKEFLELLRADLKEVCGVLSSLAKQHRNTVMVGRTHGQHALPITFGLKVAVFLDEFMRHVWRLGQAERRLAVGKMIGAVGTGAGFGPKALKIQELVMADLGLEVETGATQIVARDRYVELGALLTMISLTCERFALEIRNLQRTEIGEVEEAFGKEQVGSSTMAQKRNPITAENICGLGRVLRANLRIIEDSSLTWHERDLSNSSAERFALPHACVLADEVLVKTAKLAAGLRVRKDRMKSNLELTRGLVMAEAVIVALVAKGLGRQEAHELVRKVSHSLPEGKHFVEGLWKSAKVRKLMKKRELEAALDPSKYLGVAGKIVDEIVARQVEWAKSEK